MSDDETANRGDDQPLPPITHERRATLSASSAISARGYVTRKVAIWWGVLVSGVVSSVSSLTSGWLPGWAGLVLTFAIGVVVALFVPTRKEVPAG